MVTDEEMVRALRRAVEAIAEVDALLLAAAPRQVDAVLDACPLGDLRLVRRGCAAWMDVVLDGTTGLHIPHPRSGAA